MDRPPTLLTPGRWESLARRRQLGPLAAKVRPHILRVLHAVSHRGARSHLYGLDRQVPLCSVEKAALRRALSALRGGGGGGDRELNDVDTKAYTDRFALVADDLAKYGAALALATKDGNVVQPYKEDGVPVVDYTVTVRGKTTARRWRLPDVVTHEDDEDLVDLARHMRGSLCEAARGEPPALVSATTIGGEVLRCVFDSSDDPERPLTLDIQPAGDNDPASPPAGDSPAGDPEAGDLPAP